MGSRKLNIQFVRVDTRVALKTGHIRRKKVEKHCDLTFYYTFVLQNEKL